MNQAVRRQEKQRRKRNARKTKPRGPAREHRNRSLRQPQGTARYEPGLLEADTLPGAIRVNSESLIDAGCRER